MGLVRLIDEASRGVGIQPQQAGGGAAIRGALRLQQALPAALPLSLPERELRGLSLGIGLEPFPPLAVAAALGGQGLAAGQPGEILGQDAPGDGIDDQMMERQEEPLHGLRLPLDGQVVQPGPGQGLAAGGIQRPLQEGQLRLQLGLAERPGIQPGQRRQHRLAEIALARRRHP
ncbi:hypothetical protein D3C79_591810 [compost metagenome]